MSHQIRIINNTDIHWSRLLILYSEEIASVRGKNIESIVFDTCSMAVFGIDSILLEIKE